VTTLPQASFGQIHFGGLELGDGRVNHRIVELADILLAADADSWPDKFAEPADYRAFQRIVNRPQATHNTVRATHTNVTLQRMDESGRTVLILHDTTELDYSGRSTLGLGPIGNGGGRGWECHNSLAVDPDTRSVIGLANQILHRRPNPQVTKTEGVANKRNRANRESRLWWRGVEAIGDTRTGTTWIHVCDRGADTFEFLSQMVDAKRSFVIRSKSNRALETNDTPSKLHDVLRLKSATIGWRGVARSGDGRSRDVKLEACWSEVVLRPPHVRRGDHRRLGVRMWAIRVWEVDVPVGEEAVEWMLLTDQALTDAESVRRVVGYYQCRPIVEEYHKALKSGCGVEKLQQRSRSALEAAVGITSVLAVGLLGLRDLARDESRREEPASSVVGVRCVTVLSVWRLGVAEPNWSVKDFVWALGRLGGHMNRPSDGMPGWQTLWRGLRKLRQMIAYDNKARLTCGTS